LAGSASRSVRPLHPCTAAPARAFGVPKLPKLPRSPQPSRRARSLSKTGEVLLRHRQHHPLLRLADPHLGVRQARPYFSGARSRCTSAPSSPPISPIADEKPARPAVGHAVIEAVRRHNPAPARIASSTCFSVTALPICTAVGELVRCVLPQLRAAERWRRGCRRAPVRPPTATILSPGRAAPFTKPPRDQPDAAAEDQRVADVTVCRR